MTQGMHETAGEGEGYLEPTHERSTAFFSALWLLHQCFSQVPIQLGCYLLLKSQGLNPHVAYLAYLGLPVCPSIIRLFVLLWSCLTVLQTRCRSAAFSMPSTGPLIPHKASAVCFLSLALETLLPGAASQLHYLSSCGAWGNTGITSMLQRELRQIWEAYFVPFHC